MVNAANQEIHTESERKTTEKKFDFLDHDFSMGTARMLFFGIFKSDFVEKLVC